MSRRDLDDAEREIDAILFACIEHPESEWAEAVADACRRHPEHAGALQRRLEVLDLFRGPVPSEPGEPRVPERIASYRPIRRLASGGMGIVWLAEHEPSGRPVALKQMHAHLAGPRAEERFRREIAAVARLDHPGICEVIEAGETADGLFIAMRYVEGETLQERLLRTRAARRDGDGALPDVAQTLLLLQKLAEALHAAHEAGLVHRDVKPANIILTEADEPVLLDFGLARDSSLITLTATKARIGTPAYMSPEQVDGASREVGPRADIYSLGVVLYECLTLRLPYRQPLRDVYESILADDPPDPARFHPEVGAEVRGILEKALEKRPERRYATAAELAADLARVLAGARATVRPRSKLARLLRRARRANRH